MLTRPGVNGGWMVQVRAANATEWRPAITGAMNQTGESDEQASTFERVQEARAFMRQLALRHAEGDGEPAEFRVEPTR